MKGHINISNYEEYVIDYIDGTLSTEDEVAFTAFLALHPDAAEEVDAMRDVSALEADPAVKMDASALKMEVEAVGALNENTYESYFSAAADDSLAREEQAEVEAFLAKNPKLQGEFNLYQRSVLKPDAQVVYPEKQALKRSIPLWEATRPTALRVAAALVVLLAGYTVLNTLTNTSIYMPRETDYDVTWIELPAEPDAKSSAESTSSSSSSTPTKTVRLASANPTVRSTSTPQPIGRLNASEIEVKTRSEVEQRSLAAYSPSIPQGLEASPQEPVYASNNTEVLNLNQFVGKKVLGLDPEKTQTTTGLIREGLLQAINKREDVALTASEKEGRGKTIEFLAGNFGFKRVSYDQ